MTMAIQSIKLPDVGEGVAEAELVEWHVNVGDIVREDMVLAAVMTGKATVEIPSPVEGEVTWRHGEVGDVIATGTVILKIKVAGEDGDHGEDEEDKGEPVVVSAPAAGGKSDDKPENEPPPPVSQSMAGVATAGAARAPGE